MWEYRKIALNHLSPKTRDVDLLNEAGCEGWELIAILPNNIAYLKRKIPSFVADAALQGEGGISEGGRVELNGIASAAEPTRVHCEDAVREEPRPEVKASYRDPKTGDTWSGRGRMAKWLKRKQDAGEDIDGYLV